MFVDSYDYGVTNPIGFNSSSVWIIISLVVAIIGGICLYFTVFSDKNEGKYQGFMSKLYDYVKFKKMYITVILKVSYLVFAIYLTLVSFTAISTSFLAFLLILIFGNLILRLVYEFSLVLLSIQENVSEINKKMQK